MTNQALGTVRFQLLAGEDNYYGCWQKVRSMLTYIYKHYYGSYDWFFVSDDSIPFVLVENLRRYLGSDEITAAEENGSPLLGSPVRLSR